VAVCGQIHDPAALQFGKELRVRTEQDTGQAFEPVSYHA
jgi:hypothetical protein